MYTLPPVEIGLYLIPSFTILQHHLHVRAVMAFVDILEEVLDALHCCTGLDVDVCSVLDQELLVVMHHVAVICNQPSYLDRS